MAYIDVNVPKTVSNMNYHLFPAGFFPTSAAEVQYAQSTCKHVTSKCLRVSNGLPPSISLSLHLPTYLPHSILFLFCLFFLFIEDLKERQLERCSSIDEAVDLCGQLDEFNQMIGAFTLASVLGLDNLQAMIVLWREKEAGQATAARLFAACSGRPFDPILDYPDAKFSGRSVEVQLIYPVCYSRSSRSDCKYGVYGP